MERDLVITPGWTWHEHVHRGSDPIIWLDALDVPLHLYLGVGAFEPGPVHDAATHAPDDIFVHPGFAPALTSAARPYSPLFRYPWNEAHEALLAAPQSDDGTRQVRYTNPMTGGPVMQSLDCWLVEIPAGTQSRPFRTNAHSICVVLDGSGSSQMGERQLEWAPKDIFVLPSRTWIAHTSASETTRLFMVSDRPVLADLKLLTEETA
jgi:gentisate 1,2-dioxygenase